MSKKGHAFIRLNRSALSNGRTIGRICGTVLRRRIALTRRIQKRRSIPDRLIEGRIREFARNVRRVAPHWLDEAKGMADGAGVSVDDLLMLNCLPGDFYPPYRHNCTTFVAVGSEENRLFKIRDQSNLPQAFSVKETRSQIAFQGANTIGNLGTAHAFNRHAVAGACNTGSHTELVPDDPLLDDCHMLRFVAENATSVDEAPGLLERLIKGKVAGGAKAGRGAILMLADRNRGLLLESHAQDYSARFVERGTLVVSNHFLTRKAKAWEWQEPIKNTLLRRKRMETLLARCSRPPTPLEIFAVSRDRKSRPHALCNDEAKRPWMTVSAQLQCINRRAPDASVNYICCGNTRNSVYVPVPLAFAESFEPLLSGRFFAQADRLYRKHGCDAHLRRTQNVFEKSAVARNDTQQLLLDAYDLVRRAR